MGKRTLVTVEILESTLVTSYATIVTIVKVESSNVTLVSEDNNINVAHHYGKEIVDLELYIGNNTLSLNILSSNIYHFIIIILYVMNWRNI